jgi:hypothetical protein
MMNGDGDKSTISNWEDPASMLSLVSNRAICLNKMHVSISYAIINEVDGKHGGRRASPIMPVVTPLGDRMGSTLSLVGYLSKRKETPPAARVEICQAEGYPRYVLPVHCGSTGNPGPPTDLCRNSEQPALALPIWRAQSARVTAFVPLTSNWGLLTEPLVPTRFGFATSGCVYLPENLKT